MVHDSDERWLKLAQAVSSGERVDWDHVAQQSGDEQESGVVRALRAVEEIARVHKSSVPTVSAAADPPQRPSDPHRWRNLVIIQRVGHGTFGAVYRAREEGLDREVALKLLWPRAGDTLIHPSTVLKEARMLARVRHPNVVTVYGAESVDGRVGLWMEFIQGRTLEDLLTAHGPFGAREAAPIGIDLCDALAAVHGVGLLHRDVKCRNVMREEGGRIVLMDFGASAEATVTQRGLRTDLTGTPVYLAPELFESGGPSAASDVYSLGVLLYHLVSDGYPVEGATREDIRRAHERRERRRLRDSRPNLPDSFVRVVERALAYEPSERYQTAGAFADELAASVGFPVPQPDHEPRYASALDLKRSLEWSIEPHVQPRARRRMTAVLAAVCMALASGLFFVLLRDTPPSGVQYSATRFTYDDGLTTDPAISPDGKLVAFASDRSGDNHLDIYVQQTTGGPAVRLTHTDGDDHEPTFSPDSSTIVFRSEREGGGLYAIPSLGGDARLLAHAGHDPRFSPDGRYIAYTTSKSGTDAVAATGRCYVIPAEGGQPRLVSPDFRGATWPVWSGNRTLLFLGRPGGNETMKWWATDVENLHLVASTILPLSARSSASNHGSNQLVFVSGADGDVGGVWTLRFDPRTATATGAPSRVALGMGDGVRVSLANTGTIAVARTDVAVNVWSLPLSGNGVPTQLTFDGAPKSLPDLSPDGRYLTFVTTRSGNRDVYLRDLTTGRETAITTSPLGESHPLFTSHGSHVAYAQYPGSRKPFRVFTYPTAGGLPDMLTDGADARFDQVSDDGRYVTWHAGGEPVVEVQDLKTKTRAVILNAQPRSIYQPRISGDGQWVTFLVKTDETDSRIYAARFRGTQRIPSSDWIPLTKGTAADDKPRLTADHRRLLFTSESDGYRCIWVQELDPTTLRPLGEPKAIHHFHSARRSMARVLANLQEIAIGGDRLIFNMAETTGNLWLLQPETASR